jgi:hypothetical protein
MVPNVGGGGGGGRSLFHHLLTSHINGGEGAYDAALINRYFLSRSLRLRF